MHYYFSQGGADVYANKIEGTELLEITDKKEQSTGI